MPSSSNNEDGKSPGKSKNAGSAEQKCPHAEEKESIEEPSKTISFRASLFFDGTQNNRNNVALGKSKSKPKNSYANDYSNVAILETNWKAGIDENKFPTQSEEFQCFSFYIEGIGTEDNESDTTYGLALGKGSTGVIAKVDKGLTQIVKEIQKRHTQKDIKIENIYLDSFGFSRGAAAARYFIYAALEKQGKTLKDQLVNEGYQVGQVKFIFNGLYDTVASLGLSHKDNTNQLKLRSVTKAEKVIHLCAADEHRKNFRLTDINSAGSKGVEIYLPGVHTDVGGGYPDGRDEVDLQVLDLDRILGPSSADKLAFKRERKWLLQYGWNTEDEIQKVNFWNELKVTRRGISNKYQRIPLKIMSKLADESGVTFESKLKLKNATPKDLKTFETKLEKYVKGCVTKSIKSKADDWFKDDSELIKKIRHDYFHFSGFYGSTVGANAPQWSDNDPVNGSRVRIIQHG